MKDEEMAEQFADNISGLELTCSLLAAKDKSHAYRLGRYDGFLAGLKAGRPQWHDLRKDPKDLPKGDMYMTLKLNDENTCYKYCVAFWNKDEKVFNTIFCGKVNSEDIIAWCEIPTFDKE